MDRILEFSGNHTLLVLALVGSFLLLIFSELRRKATGVRSLPAGDAIALINKDAVVIDVRSVEAYGRGHIVNAKNVPADDLDAKMDNLAPLKDKTIVAVCDAGMSSTKVVDKLRKAGFENVYGLKGGMTGWTQEGLPVVTGKKTALGGKQAGKARKKKQSS
jgi:rhodanese-related sulfurtransferase